MKFEDLLMQQPSEENPTKFQLQEQVERLQEELEGELELNRVLQCAIKGGPVGCCESCSCLSPLLPFKVQVLLAELSVVEEEIGWLEARVNELKLCLYEEKKKTREWEVVQARRLPPQRPVQRQLKKLASRRPGQIRDDHYETLSTSQNYEYRRQKIPRDRRASIGSSMELQNITLQEEFCEGEEPRNSRCPKSQIICIQADVGTKFINPNKLSVELIKCLVGIFLKLNQTSSCKSKGTTNLTKHTLTCMNSGLVSKAAFSCKTPVFPVNHSASHLDPYEILPEPEVTIRDIGPYKDFIQITRTTLDARRLSECLPAMQRLRGLMQNLSKVNLNYFTHKQKLAFWINVYNATLMNAFLQHGLPSTPEKLLALVHEAAINVGGYVLKASTIEHFVLRHPAEVNHELNDEKEMRLRQACGLDYPEPNVVFALCRGSWSSPALRFYTADEVMNELEKAKTEYLEASVGITSRKRILVPKLVEWHMKDFADDMESLVEWIYSQLPHRSSLKRSMMEWLSGEAQQCSPSSHSQKLVEIQPYAAEFRYMIPL